MEAAADSVVVAEDSVETEEVWIQEADHSFGEFKFVLCVRIQAATEVADASIEAETMMAVDHEEIKAAEAAEAAEEVAETFLKETEIGHAANVQIRISHGEMNAIGKSVQMASVICEGEIFYNL